MKREDKIQAAIEAILALTERDNTIEMSAIRCLTIQLSELISKQEEKL